MGSAAFNSLVHLEQLEGYNPSASSMSAEGEMYTGAAVVGVVDEDDEEEEEEEEEGEEEAATSMRPAEVPGASSLSYV